MYVCDAALAAIGLFWGYFDPRPVEQEKLDKILEAGRIVPTACNYRPQRFYVLRSPQALAKAKPNAWHFKRMPLENFVTEL